MSFLYTSTCFEHNCAHHQEVKIVSHSAAQVGRGLQSSPNLCIGRPPAECDDARCCVIQLWPPDDGHSCARNM